MKKCLICTKDHDGSYGSGRFCSQPCSRSFATKAKRAEINSKVSLKLKKNNIKKNNLKKNNPKKYIEKICPICGKVSSKSIAHKNTVTCSKSCGLKWTYDTRNPNYEKNMASAVARGIKSASTQKETRRSKNEILFAELCTEKFPDTLTNEGMFNGWDADVVIPQLKIAVLWNGAWHYKEISKKNSLLQIQNRDKIKLKEIEKSGYTPYVIKDMGKFNKDFVNEKWLEFLEYLKNNNL